MIAPKVGPLKLKGGTQAADGQLAGSPSVLFDAVALILAKNAAERLAAESAAVDFVRDAFGHLKAIGCTPECQPLLDRAGVIADAGVTSFGKEFVKAAGTRFYAREPSVRALA